MARKALTLAEATLATAATPLPAGAEVSFSGVSIDSRTLRAGELFVAIAGPRFDGHDFVKEAAARGAAAAMVHHDVDGRGLPLLRVEDTTRALGDLARHHRRQSEASVVAITGSTGKTTTKDLAAAILATRGPVLKTEGNLNNQYGLPLTLLRLSPEHEAVVLELGMSAKGELRTLSRIAEPDLAVITNVGRAHLEFFASADEIAKAKAEILEGLRPSGTAVLNAEDPRVRALGESLRGRKVVWFGRDRRVEVSGEGWRGTAFGGRFDLVIGGHKTDVALPLPGPHFMMDFLAAAAVAHVLGVAPAHMAAAVSSFSAGKHRSQVRRLGQGVVLFDDCYNSSPEALDAAVSALSMAGGERRVAVLGDMLELGPQSAAIHEERGAAYAGKLEVLAAVGPMGQKIAEGACRAGLPTGAVHLFADAAAAATAVPALVRAGDAVLVKASRGMKLEAVVDALGERFGESA